MFLTMTGRYPYFTWLFNHQGGVFPSFHWCIHRNRRDLQWCFHKEKGVVRFFFYYMHNILWGNRPCRLFDAIIHVLCIVCIDTATVLCGLDCVSRSCTSLLRLFFFLEANFSLTLLHLFFNLNKKFF